MNRIRSSRGREQILFDYPPRQGPKRIIHTECNEF